MHSTEIREKRFFFCLQSKQFPMKVFFVMELMPLFSSRLQVHEAIKHHSSQAKGVAVAPTQLRWGGPG